MSRRRDKIGLWMIGAAGSVGGSVALGLAALGKGLIDTTGLVTALPPFHRVPLPAPRDIVVGGHEVRAQSLADAVGELHRDAGLYDRDLIKACATDLRRMDRNIVRGTVRGAGDTMRQLADDPDADASLTPATVIERLAYDIAAFRAAHGLTRVVVVHLASSEPPLPPAPAHASYRALARALTRRNASAIAPPSVLYALAAIEAGCAYINFTPSPSLDIPAVRERADARSIPYMGSDGKTGETLIKAALAPMFATRNLEVLSWTGQNILGNRDGAVLRDPSTRVSKIRSKEKTLSAIVGHTPATHVGIDYVASLGDWKVAWDFIHFRGFLGTRMHMQFTWHGADSALAAPLVIDLTRLAAAELAAGGRGPMRHLAFFFKDPIDADRYDLASQWLALTRHTDTLAGPTDAAGV